MAPLKAARTLLMWCLLAAGTAAILPSAIAATASETQIKAVFLFNFSHFVEWPPGNLGAPQDPFVIGVLGGDSLASELDEAVRGETVDQHPLQVRRFRTAADVADCHILFIDRSAGATLEEILAQVKGRGTLTVSDLDGASRRGVMIQFANQNNRVRLLINVDSARAAGLTISSNLLRLAEIVGSSD